MARKHGGGLAEASLGGAERAADHVAGAAAAGRLGRGRSEFGGSCRGVVSAPAPLRDAEPCRAAVAPGPAQALGARPGFRALAGLLPLQHLQAGKQARSGPLSL